MTTVSKSGKLSDTRSSIPDPRPPRVSIIVAMARNRVIGAGGKLPWHLPSDLKRFKALTMGHHIIMGRKTFESIGRILPGRTSVVISRNPGYQPSGALVAGSLSAALTLAGSDSEVFVIGGEEIFREALPVANRIYATEIALGYEGDVYFPVIDRKQWQEVSRETFAEAQIRGRFVTYERSVAR